MKKVLSIVLSAVMLISCATGFAFAGMSNFKTINTYKEGQFKDVKASAWYAENIKTAYEMGLVKGASEDTFNVKGNLTVAETLALAARIHKMYVEGNADFVQGSPWYQVYVDYCADTGLVATNNLPKMTSACTRGLFANIMAGAIPESMNAINTVGEREVPDVQPSYIYSDEVRYLMQSGIITGYEDGSFRPDSTISRAEVSAIVTRLADPGLRKTIVKNYYDGHLGSAGYLSGKTVLVTVLVTDDLYSWPSGNEYNEKMWKFKTTLDGAVSFIQRECAKYGCKPEFVYDFYADSELLYGLKYPGIYDKEHYRYYVIRDGINQYIDGDAIKEKYGADNIVYIAVRNNDEYDTHHNSAWMYDPGSGVTDEIVSLNMINKWSNTDPRELSSASVAHEILHTFGAQDIYYANTFITQAYVDYVTGIKLRDIMRGTNYDYNITETTAYYLGLIDYAPDVAKFGLGEREPK